MMANLSRITTTQDGELVIEFPYNSAMVADVKKIPNIKWNKDLKYWYLPEGTIVDDDLINKIKSFAKDYRMSIAQRAEKYLGVKGNQIESPEVNERYNARDQYNRDMIISIRTKDDKSGVIVNTPYDSALVNAFRKIPGAHFDQLRKNWDLPIANQSELDNILSKIKSIFPQSETKVSENVRKSQEERQDEERQGIFSIEKGEGYGGQPYKEGQILRHKDRDGNSEIFKVLSASQRYFREDGMSFGVGDESGYIYSAKVQKATPEEAKPLILKEERLKDRVQINDTLSKVKKLIQEEGERPPGDNRPEGNRLFDTQTIYGGGDWFVVGDQYIWYVRNNGADGDNWANNNVITGGAGAIGWRIPKDTVIAERLEGLVKAKEKLDKEDNLTEGEKTLLLSKLPELKSSEHQSTKSKSTPDKVKKPEYSFAELQKIHSERSPQSQAMDDAQLHSKVISHTSPSVNRWVRDQGTADIQGIDTPSRKVTPTFRKHKPALAKKSRERNVYGMPGVVQSGRGKNRKRHHKL